MRDLDLGKADVTTAGRRSRGRTSRIRPAFAASAALLVALSACGGPSGSGQDDKAPWRVGVVTSFTGPANALGLEEIASYRLAAELVNSNGGINGRRVEVVEDDDQSQPQQAVTVVNKQISRDKVVGIVGGLSTGAALAVKPIIEKNQLPLAVAAVGVAVTDGNPRYVFRSTVSDRVSNSWVLTYMKEKGFSRLAVIHDSNAYGTGSLEMMRDLITRSGSSVKVVTSKSFNINDTDVRAQLTAIAAEKPEALYIIGTNPAPALVVKQANELGLRAQLIGSTGILNPKTIEIAGKEAAEGLVVPGLGSADSVRPEQQPFVDAFEKKYNRKPKGFEWLGDGMYLILKGLEHVTAAPGDIDKARKQLRDAMEQHTKEMSWSGGPFNYSADNHEGADERTITPMIVKDGRFVSLK